MGAWNDPTGTGWPWRKYRCTCGYRCVGDFRMSAHEHTMQRDGEAHPGTPPEFYEPDVKPNPDLVTVLAVSRG